MRTERASVKAGGMAGSGADAEGGRGWVRMEGPGGGRRVAKGVDILSVIFSWRRGRWREGGGRREGGNGGC